MPRRELHPQLSDERQVIRRHQRQPRSRQLHLHHLDVSLVVDVIQVQDGEHARIRPPAAEVCPQINALQPGRQHLRGEPAHPFIEVPEHDFRGAHTPVVQDRAEPPGLMAPFENRGSQVHVVQVQDVVADGDVHPLAAARFARAPRQVVLGVMADRQPAHDHVAEQAAAQLACRRHDPPHAEQRAQFLGMTGRRMTGPDHFLQRDDVGIDAADDLCDAGWIGAAVETPAAVDVVGGDPEGAPMRVGHQVGG